MSFDTLGLSTRILEAVAKQGYDTPTPIQEQAIPAILNGHDVMAAAQTGTGKTAGFTLPLLEKLSGGKGPRANHVRALVLTPTRELAAQVSDSVMTYGSNLPLRSAVVFGGVNINPQMQKLRKGVDILVATPGRLLDLHSKNAVKLDQVEVFVLDEADRMLDMGFINDIKKVIALLPKRRQNLLFSATFSEDIRNLAKGLINNPIEISVTPKNTAAKTVDQLIVPVDKGQKSALLIKLIKEHKWYQVLVFCRTKHGANKLSHQLVKSGITSAPIHGNKSQGARTRALADFKKGDVQVLVATDIAARGIDIDQLPQVVNFDLPHVAEDYVHRIGRTGRAGAEGKAVSLVCAAEYKELTGIERLIQQVLPREIVPGFEPKERLGASPAKPKPLKPKRPKKKNPNKNEHHDGPRSDKASAKKSHNNESVWKTSGDSSVKPQENKPRRRRRPSKSTQTAKDPR
ncbi:MULTISPECIES: DEAD/DEAH box helicase [unclassified Oleiphilus]|jgi:ATP-dependent RNA helicase RhlE|uniref:DEAD/DEAH box helicase n=1 Tax=unclassified Oleiphilus TaxID=2631174 RepID=UPI0009EDF713|nr:MULTISPECIES: DEAD/DEAH box helicase [unclassified Oleiphilus]